MTSTNDATLKVETILTTQDPTLSPEMSAVLIRAYANYGQSEANARFKSYRVINRLSRAGLTNGAVIKALRESHGDREWSLTSGRITQIVGTFQTAKVFALDLNYLALGEMAAVWSDVASLIRSKASLLQRADVADLAAFRDFILSDGASWSESDDKADPRQVLARAAAFAKSDRRINAEVTPSETVRTAPEADTVQQGHDDTNAAKSDGLAETLGARTINAAERLAELLSVANFSDVVTTDEVARLDDLLALIGERRAALETVNA